MNPTICWPDKTLPVEIHCAPEVLANLEVAAADGLLAMPRIGLGVGGLLLGKRENGRIEITRSVEIACSHRLGPGFVLTPEEIEAGRGSRLTETAEVANEAHDSDVVGWYCSKPGGLKAPGPLSLTDHDRVLFDAFCPQLWQVALLIRPNIGNTTTAAFGMRGSDGFVVGEPQELEWPELTPADEPAAEPTSVEVAPVIESEVQESEVQAPAEPEPLRETIAETPVPAFRGGTLFGIPDSAADEPKRERRWWPVWLSIVAILLAGLAAAAYFTRQYWIPRGPLALIASSNWRGRVAILWNAEALAGEEQGILTIDDGAGPVHTIHLDRAGLSKGVYEYDGQPVSARLRLVTDDFSGTATVKVQAEPYLPESGISK